MIETTGQKKVYAFIVSYIKEHLYPPSIREICKGCNYSSTSTVYEHLNKLHDKGLIELGQHGNPRCIKLVGYKIVKKKHN